MELIPILSTIILVATISTFLLSIGAYILYKIRERRVATSPKTVSAPIHAELVVPADVIPSRVTMQTAKSTPYQSPFTVQKPAQPVASSKQHDFPQKPPKFSVEETKKMHEPRQSSLRKSGETKFFKYTSEGYVPTEDDKVTGTFKWR